MAGKQEIKPGVVIDYKEKLDDRFVDLATQKTTTEANDYLTQFNTNLSSQNNQDVGSVSPYFYHSEARPGAKSPLSVEMAQHIFKNTLENVKDALRAEIARAFSSEKYLSDFMKENMVSKSEDQSITGFKDFDSVQIDHADIDTELVDDSTTRHSHVTENEEIDQNLKVGNDLEVDNDASLSGTTTSNVLNVVNRLKIPKKIASNPQEGELWYNSVTGNQSSGVVSPQPGLVGLGFTDTESGVSFYDGSLLISNIKSDSKYSKIRKDGSYIYVPCGVEKEDIEVGDGILIDKSNGKIKLSIDETYLNELVISKIYELVGIKAANDSIEIEKVDDKERSYAISVKTIDLGSWE